MEHRIFGFSELDLQERSTFRYLSVRYLVTLLRRDLCRIISRERDRSNCLDYQSLF